MDPISDLDVLGIHSYCKEQTLIDSTSIIVKKKVVNVRDVQ